MSLSDWLLNPGGLTPHGFCLSWAPGLVWLHAASDAVIGLAYFSVPLALASFAHQRPDLQHSRMLYLFVAFILACGMTHLMSIVTLWFPVYGIEGVIKFVTAVVSIATAILLWPLIPKLVALPSPSQLEQLNAELKANVEAQRRTAGLLRESEARVRAANVDLERRVEDKIEEVRNANVALTALVEQRGILLREVYHRVKNNLQILDALLVAQSRQTDDPDAAKGLRSLRQRIQALGLAHQQLLSSKDLKTFDIAPFLQGISDHVVAAVAHQGVRVAVDALSLNVDLDFALPFGLLVTELLTDALERALPTGAEHVAVSLRRSEGRKLSLAISHDGPGDTVGQTPPDASTFGLRSKIVAGLVAQLNGKVTWLGENGAHAEILVPEQAAP